MLKFLGLPYKLVRVHHGGKFRKPTDRGSHSSELPTPTPTPTHKALLVTLEGQSFSPEGQFFSVTPKLIPRPNQNKYKLDCICRTPCILEHTIFRVVW